MKIQIELNICFYLEKLENKKVKVDIGDPSLSL